MAHFCFIFVYLKNRTSTSSSKHVLFLFFFMHVQISFTSKTFFPYSSHQQKIIGSTDQSGLRVRVTRTVSLCLIQHYFTLYAHNFFITSVRVHIFITSYAIFLQMLFFFCAGLDDFRYLSESDQGSVDGLSIRQILPN